MNVLRYKKINLTSPKTLRKHKMYSNKTPQQEAILDEFVGKFKAKEQINSVDLKNEFKNNGAS